MLKIPLISIRCRKISRKQPYCYLSFSENEPSDRRLEFIYEHEGSGQLRLRCEHITAIDLRVEAKFGSIEAMKGTLLVECSAVTVVSTSNTPTEVLGEKSCLVKATFHVNETGAVRDVLKKMESSFNLTSNLEQGTNSVEPKTKQKPYQEGLPQWVQYVPSSLYSRRTRHCIQFAINMYFVFSVMWALWQLYRYVDFVRELIRPLVEFLKYQFELLENIVHLLNMLFEEYTVQWLCFIKPLHTVYLTMAAPVLQTFRQLSPVLQITTRGVTSFFRLLLPVLKPLGNIGYQFLFFVSTPLQGFKTYVKAVGHTIWTVWLHVGQGQLDPIKAQFLFIRTTVIQSGKAISLGLVRLFSIIYKVMWLRQAGRIKKED